MGTHGYTTRSHTQLTVKNKEGTVIGLIGVLKQTLREGEGL